MALDSNAKDKIAMNANRNTLENAWNNRCRAHIHALATLARAEQQRQDVVNYLRALNMAKEEGTKSYFDYEKIIREKTKKIKTTAGSFERIYSLEYNTLNSRANKAKANYDSLMGDITLLIAKENHRAHVYLEQFSRALENVAASERVWVATLLEQEPDLTKNAFIMTEPYTVKISDGEILVSYQPPEKEDTSEVAAEAGGPTTMVGNDIHFEFKWENCKENHSETDNNTVAEKSPLAEVWGERCQKILAGIMLKKIGEETFSDAIRALDSTKSSIASLKMFGASFVAVPKPRNTMAVCQFTKESATTPETHVAPQIFEENANFFSVLSQNIATEANFHKSLAKYQEAEADAWRKHAKSATQIAEAYGLLAAGNKQWEVALKNNTVGEAPKILSLFSCQLSDGTILKWQHKAQEQFFPPASAPRRPGRIRATFTEADVRHVLSLPGQIKICPRVSDETPTHGLP